MGKGFTSSIKPVQELTASNPKHTRSILKQRCNINSTQTVRLFGIVREDFKLIAIEPVEAILCAKPHEPLIILNNFGNPSLR